MKKTKLLLSLAMMCLSIAVLCFGVLAATSVTYSISGTISYEVNDVFVKINTSVYAIAEQQDKTTVIATVKGMESVSQENSLSINSKTYTRTQTMDEYDSTNADTGSATGIDLTYGGTKGYYTYYIVINIQNLSASKNVSAYIEEGENMSAETYSVKTTNLYQNDISFAQAKNIVIAYAIKDRTNNISDINIDYILHVSYTQYEYPYAGMLQKDDSGYYISLGTGYKVKGVSGWSYTEEEEELSDVVWRLVSLDGVSRYTYDSSDAIAMRFDEKEDMKYLSDAVFLQEFAVNGTLAFDSNGNTNYFESEIRNGVDGSRGALKDGSYFNLTSSDDLSFIKDRDLGNKLYKYTTKYVGYQYSSKETTYVERPSTDTTKDKFWLLDPGELEMYKGGIGFSSTTWQTDDGVGEVGYWFRSAYSYDDGRVCRIDGSGTTDSMDAKRKDCQRVRAAFQLV